MSSNRKRAANRENAQHSTGPRTGAGKASSSRNATTHGLTVKTHAVLRNAADKAAFADLQSSLAADLNPAPGLEQVLFKQILVAAWNMDRCDAYIEELTNQGLDPVHSIFSGAEVNTSLANISAYYRRNERTFHKAMNLLRELQSERTYRETAGTAAQTAHVSTLVRTQPMRKAALAEDRLKIQNEGDSRRTAAQAPGYQPLAYDRGATAQVLSRL